MTNAFVFTSTLPPPPASQDRPSILITRRLCPNTQRVLETILPSYLNITQFNFSGKAIPREKLLEWAKGKDAILCMITDNVDKEVLDAAGDRLKAVGTVSVGCDHIDLKECERRGIRIYNTPDVLTDACAEHTIGLLLATARKYRTAMESVLNGTWNLWDPSWMCGMQVTGKTVGIVGLGRIGQGVASRLASFKLKQLLYTSRTEKPIESLPWSQKDLPTTFTSLNNLLQESDIVILCCALSSETRGLINSSKLRLMKPTSILINISRGTVINQEDLITALRENWIAMAGLDVTDPEPLNPSHTLVTDLKDKCIVLPHIASATMETRETMASMALYAIVEQFYPGLSMSLPRPL